MHTTLSGKCGASDLFSSGSTLTLGVVKKMAWSLRTPTVHLR